MTRDKSIKDYVIAGIAFCALVIPEVLKICLSAFYVILFFLMQHIAETRDPATLDSTQTILCVFIFLISPIGAYVFYEKTVLPGLYKELLEYLSQTESVLKFKPSEDEN